MSELLFMITVIVALFWWLRSNHWKRRAKASQEQNRFKDQCTGTLCTCIMATARRRVRTMIELRWITPEGTTTEHPKLQWRCREKNSWDKWEVWGDWRDVPTVVIQTLSGGWTRTDDGKLKQPQGFAADSYMVPNK